MVDAIDVSPKSSILSPVTLQYVKVSDYQIDKSLNIRQHLHWYEEIILKKKNQQQKKDKLSTCLSRGW